MNHGSTTYSPFLLKEDKLKINAVQRAIADRNRKTNVPVDVKGTGMDVIESIYASDALVVVHSRPPKQLKRRLSKPKKNYASVIHH
jgi:hypothetical protein